MSKNTEVMKSGLTKKAVILGVLGLFWGAVLFGDTGSFGSDYWPVRAAGFGPGQGLAYQGNHIFPCLIGTFGLGLVLVFVAAFVNQGAHNGWWKVRFSQQEVAVMMVLGSLGGLWGGLYFLPYNYWYGEIPYGLRPGIVKDPALWDIMPDIVFGPKDPSVWYYRHAAAGETKLSYYFWQIPWVAIAPMLITSFLFIGGMILCLICSSMLFRYIWTKVEYLAFPFAEVYGSFIDLAEGGSSSTSSKKVKMFSSWLLLIGFLVSFIWQFLLFGLDRWVMLAQGVKFGAYSGYLPDFSTWRASNTLGWPGYDFTTYALMPFAAFFFAVGPWEIGWASFIPLNVIVSALIGYFAMFVIFPLVYAPIAGWGTMPPNLGVQDLINDFYVHSSDGFSIAALFIGMVLAVVFVPLVIHRQEALTILKGIFKEPDPSFDPDRPIPYRWTWWLMIAGFLLWFSVGVGIMQIQPLPLLFFGIILVVLYTGVGKIISESGGHMGNTFPWPGSNGYDGLIGAAVLSNFNVIPTTETSGVMAVWLMNNRGNAYAWGERVPWYSLYSMKLSDSKKVKTKAMLTAVILGFIASLIIGGIAYEGMKGYRTPETSRGYLFSQIIPNAEKGTMAYWENSIVNMDKTVTLIVVGFVLIFALSIVQRRVSLLRSLSVGGLIAGLTFGYGFWSAWLVTFIIKYLVFTVGGVRLFEEKMKPIALGFFAGGLMSNLMAYTAIYLLNVYHII